MRLQYTVANGTDRNNDGIPADRPDIGNPGAPIDTRAIVARGCGTRYQNPNTGLCVNPGGVHWIEGIGNPRRFHGGLEYLADRRNKQRLQKYQIKDPVSYFFESGHKFQTEANLILDGTFSLPDIRSQYNYFSHTFATKIPDPPSNPCVRPLQAADILAWHVRKWKADQGRRLPRLDYLSLLESPHFILNMSSEHLDEMSKMEPDMLRIIGASRQQDPQSL